MALASETRAQHESDRSQNLGKEGRKSRRNARGEQEERLVEAHLPQSVRELLQWTVDFFRTNLLGWIREHGGWISSFPALASASMRSVGSVGWGGVLIFIAGLALGSLFTARLLSRT
uniref:Uncharacterized protein n=1 Tax=Knipowitschia caucasica TaxID=637954 RepID=A0AAV2M1U1_KNICA